MMLLSWDFHRFNSACMYLYVRENNSASESQNTSKVLPKQPAALRAVSRKQIFSCHDFFNSHTDGVKRALRFLEEIEKKTLT
mmetsp:Transcript_5636/g.6992  ORF Transcript_5636/g.6992 Transcript_5636/m.6992 type:complete len:82 (-) Transcript_5636:59-304(-)